MQRIVFFLLLFNILCVFAQDELLMNKEFTIDKDTILLEKNSIQQVDFKITQFNEVLDTTKFKVDFLKGYVIIKDSLLNGKKIHIQYRKFPNLLTKTYYLYSDSLIVEDNNTKGKLFSYKSKQKNTKLNPFNGLQTNGTLSRGITIGNNQDGVLDSNLDLQITGKLSSKVRIRANITDSNAPVNNNGYSQRLNEFDRVYIELFSKNWKITAGDLNLLNNQYYTTFQKKIKGLSVAVNNDSKTWKYYTSGGLVEGVYKKTTLTGQNANQGPYKITNESDRQLLLISGSESVFVNGTLLKRGENKDYMINYNTAEIIFNPTFPIRLNSRIVVEYQVNNSNYTRFVTNNKVAYKKNNLDFSVNYFAETDFKNQSLNTSFTDEQKQILVNAGDHLDQLFAPNEIETTYSNSLILYKKEQVNGVDIYTFSTNENETLYTVSFTYVGENLGDYVVDDTLASGRVYRYVSPIGGINQGNYMPFVKLNAPNSLQVISLNGNYSVKDKTFIKTNFAYSNKDLNLYSPIDDNNNNGFAGKLQVKQVLINKPWKLTAKVNAETIQNKFNTIERIQNIEYNRDWNINAITGTQESIITELEYKKDSVGRVLYQFENLAVGTDFKGNKHQFVGNIKHKKYTLATNNSILSSKSTTENTSFFKSFTQINTIKNKKWIGLKSAFESNKRKETITNELSNLSFNELELEGFIGIGDTAKVYSEIGYQFTKIDSVAQLKLNKVTQANTFFIRTKLLSNKQSNLSIYADYRETENINRDNEYNFNARLNFRQSLLSNNISFTTVYQNSAGVIPQQDFKYVETNAGQGFFQWIDYNENGIKELDEFEIANFTDQANYLRIVLPSTNFIKVNTSKVSQLLNVNFNRWKKEKGYKKFVSKISTQSTFVLDNKQVQNKNDYLNLFNTSNSLSYNYQLKNSVFYNRGLQNYSFVYNNLQSKNKQYLVYTTQESKLNINQLQFFHKIKKNWLMDNLASIGTNTTIATNVIHRDYTIHSIKNNLKLSYLRSSNSRVTAFYQFNLKENEIGEKEKLKSNKLGLKFLYNKLDKFSFSSEFSWINHDYSGTNYTPVSFQLLEGLQPGKNYTWNILIQKKINSFLNLNINYNGRKSENFKTIHIGNIQLRANF